MQRARGTIPISRVSVGFGSKVARFSKARTCKVAPPTGQHSGRSRPMQKGIRDHRKHQLRYSWSNGPVHTHVERIVPGRVTIATFEEHEARYQFAGAFVKGKRVLDVACGAGIGTSYLLKAGARSCAGIDISRDAVDFASDHYPGPTFLLGDSQNIPLRDESVDVVVSFETMEHVSDPSEFMAECYRVLIPGGVFVGSTPHDPVLRWIDPGNPFHLHEFSVQKMVELLSAKFRDIHLFAQSPVVYPATVAKQLCVRVLNLVRLTEPVLRMMGKSHLVTLCDRDEYDFSEIPSKIVPYCPSWFRQPTVTVATGIK